MADELLEEVEHQGTIRIVFTGHVIPHWRYEFVEGDRNLIEEFMRRTNATIGLLPPGDPQFRRNRDRVQRDGDREGVVIDWVGINLPDTDTRGPAQAERAEQRAAAAATGGDDA